jgi:hypothetical protein
METYEIRLKGHLGSRWAARFDGMTLTVRADGTTLLEGRVVDQAALHGLLHTVRDIGLPLLSITRTQETTMTTTALRTPVVEPVRTDPSRKNVFAAGVLYLLTFVSSIPALALFLGPVLHNPDYIVSAGQDTRVVWGCLLDVVNALAAIGTAVALFPVIKRHNESLALGFVTSRLLEAAVIMIGVVSLLAVVTLRQSAGADPSDLVTTGRALVAVRDWTFLLGPGLMPAFNALLLGTLLYRARLVPRFIPLMGLIGAPLLLTSMVCTLFGVFGQVSGVSFFLTLPVAAWELSIGIWMMAKGFRPAAAK